MYVILSGSSIGDLEQKMKKYDIESLGSLQISNSTFYQSFLGEPKVIAKEPIEDSVSKEPVKKTTSRKPRKPRKPKEVKEDARSNEEPDQTEEEP